MVDSLPPPKVLILGAGEFGLSFAYSLSQSKKYEGYTNLITIIDRSSDPPSLDAASSDYNKIVRSDYSDKYYASLASLALQEWRKEEWSPYYFESGTIIASSTTSPIGSEYVSKSLCVNLDPELMVNGIGPTSLKTMEEFRKYYPEMIKIGMGTEEDLIGYVNPNCGWADARKAMEHLCRKTRSAGVTFLVGEVNKLLYLDDNEKEKEKSEVRGVETSDGRTLLADRIVVAMGAWSSKLVPELSADLLASGQYVGHLQLTEEERKTYSNSPVTFFLDSGFYCFPPTKEGILKVAIHGPGYLNPSPSEGLISTPRTFLDNPKDQIPLKASKNLRKELGRVYPDLIDRDWISTRLCWYTDSPTSNWLLSPSYNSSLQPSASLFYATAGSGHGFKFAPILGDSILKAFNNELDEEEEKRFSFLNLKRPQGAKGDASRGGLIDIVREVLCESEMRW